MSGEPTNSKIGMQFQDIPGQSPVKTALIQASERNKMAHAQLFSSVEGGAGLALALAYSSHILCTNKAGGDSCGTCPSCLRVQKGIHPDVHYFFPKTSIKDSDYDKKLGGFIQSFRDFIQERPFGLLSDFALQAGYENKVLNISKEDSRRLIKTVSMKSVEGGAKIILIWMPEYFHPSAANAILKVLEEPPANTLFFLVTHTYESLMATITSRSLLFSIPPFSEEEVASYLQAKDLDGERASVFAKLAYGSIGEAEQLSSEADDLAYVEFRAWMLDCFNNKFADLTSRAEAFGKSDKLAQRSTLQFALNILRETLLTNEPRLTTRTGEEATFISNFGKRVSAENTQKMYEELNNAISNLERNANAKMAHFHLSSVFSEMFRK
ncbi:MAG: DNA polymerase III subunit delta [Cytophagales bacterium]|nr:DNA polymerase III subunit delta [Cytophagales bacterium]